MDLTNSIDKSITDSTLEFAKKWFDVAFDYSNSTTNFPLLVIKLVEFVEKYKTLTGFEKRDLVINILTKVLKENNTLEEKNKNTLIKLLPNTIETFIKVSNGEFTKNLKNKKQKHKNEFQIDIDEISEQLLNRLLSFINPENQNSKYLVENSTIVLLKTMNILEEYPTLTGIEKKSMAVKTFQKLLAHFNKDDLDPLMSDLLTTTSDAMPSLMETIISISKGNFELNEKKINKCVSTCGPLFIKCFGSVLKKCMKNKENNNSLDDVMKELEKEEVDIKVISEVEVDNIKPETETSNIIEKVSKIKEDTV